MRLAPVVNFTRPDGSLGSLYVGATQFLSVDEAGIRSAVAIARKQAGTDIAVSFINDDGRCVYRARVRA